MPVVTSARIDTSEVRKASFWVSQIFIIVATVLGVYLAANQGFKQAVAYGELQGDKNNFFLRKSLQNELVDNVALVRGYAERLKKGGFAARKSSFKLDTFVWESMRFSPATLETPSDLLQGSRQFYRQVAEIQEKVESNDYSAEKGIRLLTELADRMEKDILPKFDADLNALGASIKDRGIVVN